MVPCLEVTHLPSSSSFYSAVIQPLGLRYLSTEDGDFPSITYGSSGPLFRIRQVSVGRDRPLRLSHIALSAPSAAAANDAFAYAVRANPDSREPYLRHPFAEARSVASGASASRAAGGGGDIRATIKDFDGNKMDIVYRPPADYSTHYGGSTVRPTNSTQEEASRILHWNYDVVGSELATSPADSGSDFGGSARAATRRPRVVAYQDSEPYLGLRRSITTGSSIYEPTASPRENSHGLSAGAVVGTLLGVAAGAALGGAFTYNMVKQDRTRAPHQDYDAPSFSRRSTFPNQYPEHRGRFVEVERAVERISPSYPPPVDHRPPPEYIARYSQAGSRARSGDVGDMYDEPRGRHSSSRSSQVYARPRSEAPTSRAPQLLDQTEHRSHVSSTRSSKHPPIVQRSYTYIDTPDRDSYVSARSHRSSSTVRVPPIGSGHAPAESQLLSRSRSRAGSRVTTTTIKMSGNTPSPPPKSPAGTYIAARTTRLPPSREGTYISARDVRLPPSRDGTYISACDVRLPPSGVGSSHAKWVDDDDDIDSIAPSDSISCVGSSRRGSRSYY
ncbi:hypothetical protein B0H63DRAFT_448847 [Podospora didyma]|uniref:VOC domain-containing protein n=1 Tax=Podospora didyma TaxID=330526 RepID=A0AAE0NNI8_9PEZI|nr:hypothetical protein B0H63DRAFT_448847 [Podospora didyma]